MNEFVSRHPALSIFLTVLVLISFSTQIWVGVQLVSLHTNICRVVTTSRSGNPVARAQWLAAASAAGRRADSEDRVNASQDLAIQAADLRIASVYQPGPGINFPGC